MMIIIYLLYSAIPPTRNDPWPRPLSRNMPIINITTAQVVQKESFFLNFKICIRAGINSKEVAQNKSMARAIRDMFRPKYCDECPIVALNISGANIGYIENIAAAIIPIIITSMKVRRMFLGLNNLNIYLN